MATVFTKIIDGDLPGRFVHTDDDVVAFLSIAPLTTGHTLVVPRQEVDNWQLLDPDLWTRLNVVAQRVGQAIDAAFSPARIGMVVAGFEVPHVHIHVFPANDMSDFDFAHAHSLPDDVMDDAANRIRDALAELA